MGQISELSQIKDHYFLKERNAGACRKLRGNVELMVCFMKKRISPFFTSTQVKFQEALHEACLHLSKEAKKHGVFLHFTHQFFTIDIPEHADPGSGYDLIREFFDAKSCNMEELQARYKAKTGADEMSFLLVFDAQDRSFALHGNECGVIFKNSTGSFHWTTIAHELLHQFGAIDYYYPKEIKTLAETYIQDSIMGINMPRGTVDDLTAYLVGWKDTVSINSFHFLQKTMWMNQYYFSKFNCEERGVTFQYPKFNPVYAKFSGTVKDIAVTQGQIIKSNDVIITTDSAEYNTIKNLYPGRVHKIAVKPGDAFKRGSLIAVIERV